MTWKTRNGKKIWMSDFSGKIPKDFKKGSFVVHKGYGKHGHYGVITKIRSDRPDGDSRFFDVTYTHGKDQNNTDHDVHLVSRTRVPKKALKILQEYHPKV